MLRVCAFRGCQTLTLSPFCVEHEQPVPPRARAWPRGRPFPDYVRVTSDAAYGIEQPVAHAPDVVDEPGVGLVGAELPAQAGGVRVERA